MDSADEELCTLSATVTIPLSAPKVLMMELAERITTTTMVRHTQGAARLENEVDRSRRH